jgi:hypothetical protein
VDRQLPGPISNSSTRMRAPICSRPWSSSRSPKGVWFVAPAVLVFARALTWLPLKIFPVSCLESIGDDQGPTLLRLIDELASGSYFERTRQGLKCFPRARPCACSSSLLPRRGNVDRRHDPIAGKNVALLCSESMSGWGRSHSGTRPGDL